MKKIFFAISFFLFLYPCFSQTLWYITRGGQGTGSAGDESWGVDVDSAGNIYWATCEKPSGAAYYNIKLYKITEDGQQLWESNSFGGQWNEKAFIAKVSGNEVYVAGRQDTGWWTSMANALVLQYDMNTGNLNWQYDWDQGYGYEEIDGIVPLADGIYLSGWTTGSSTSNDFLIQKINYSGQLIWNQSWGTPLWDDANGHMAVDDNYIYIAGRDSGSNMISLDGNAILACFSRTDGSFLWKQNWGGSSYDDYFGMTMSADSFLYGIGFTLSYGNGSQLFLNKYTRTGTLLWSRLWGGTGAESSRAIATDGDSLVFVAGKTDSYGAGDNDILLLKYDSGGTLLDSLTWGSSGYEVAHDIVINGDFIYLCGETENLGTQNTQNDALLLKVNGRTMTAPDTLITLVPPAGKSTNGINVTFDYFQKRIIISTPLRYNENIIIRIFNSFGQELNIPLTTAGSEPNYITVFDGSALQPGMYLYRFKTGNTLVSGKFLFP